MRKSWLLLFVFLFAGLAMAQNWDVVKYGEMEFYPNAGFFFNADTGLFVGQDGAVMMTTDGGESGDFVRIPGEGDVSWLDVGFATDMVGFSCGKDGVIYKTTDGGYTWNQIGTDLGITADLNKIAVVNENVVYIAGDDGILLKTTDGGATWTQSSFSFEANGSVRDLDGGLAFCSETVGVVAAKSSKAAGATWYTHDGGENWELVFVPFPDAATSKKLYDVDAVGDSTFFVVGYNFCIFKSTDGGKSYTLANEIDLNYVYLEDVQVVDANTIIAGGSYGYVTKSTDGGVTWSDISIPAGHTIVFVAFMDDQTGYVFARDGQWFKTTDGGETYTPILGWPNVNLKALAIGNDGLMAVGGYFGNYSLSTDGGYTWSYLDGHATGTHQKIYTIAFHNNIGLIGAYHGLLLRSADGGQTWEEISNPMADEEQSIYAIRFLDDNTVLAGGDDDKSNGYIMKSTDAGLTWTLLPMSEHADIFDFWVLSSKQVIAGGESGKMFFSTEAIDSFYAGYDFGKMNMREVEFRGDNGVVVATKGYIFHTTAADWDTLEQVFEDPDGDDMLGVAFVNDTLVYAVGEHGKIYYSTDAGLTWQKDDSVTSENLERADVKDGVLWAVGGKGLIMKKDFNPPEPTSNLFINEFMASNDAAVADENGDYDDWIEIYNANGHPVDIGGMYITDDLTDPMAWQIPDSVPDITTIPAGGFLVLWADKEPEQGPLHVKIKLSSSGEQIGLSEMFEGEIHFIDSLTFSDQKTDTSFGRLTDGGDEWTLFYPSSPGETNANGTVVSIEENPNVTVKAYHLSQNYPNPFNPSTTIEFALKKPGHTTLIVYSITGQKVATLVDKEMRAGKVKLTWDASRVASGVYFYELKSGDFKAVKKMLLMK